MEELDVYLEEEFITLGQILKRESFIPSGGLAKWYLSEHTVYLNDELENRRGKKLYPGDQLKLIEDNVLLNIKKDN
ncbi:S4 domain-containing protein YaaA [Dolosicoccus paucivorans]|uniref:S4 domain-containing protein YaaA n=1 Tax=Dolosicoccus paucivorans TaxID=84521 RepID=A0A1G8K768_9LACT|nr:S4 domain-containing protein YaaA [Dolosicoccus paucivorans]PMB84735.1 S4 domain-containing protein YaaA [Dolosicoccus paucivorans]PMC58795.1 S4 domain-containing protein YaaA [Dolosicoccus paucivorans]SDI39288.1 S4 domain protein YaaA [Dolosicoccus paucivorans]